MKRFLVTLVVMVEALLSAETVSTAVVEGIALDTKANQVVLTLEQGVLSTSIAYSSSVWNEMSLSSGTAVIYVNEEQVFEATSAEGDFCFAPTKAGRYTLRFTAMGATYNKIVEFTAPTVTITREGVNLCKLTASDGEAPIRYTLDGSEPTETSALYTEPFEVPLMQRTCVKAATFAEGCLRGETASAFFDAAGSIVSESEVSCEMDTELAVLQMGIGESMDLPYDVLWEGEASSKVVLAVNGVTFAERTGAGEVVWTPTQSGETELTLQTISATGELLAEYTAQAYVYPTNYTVTDGTRPLKEQLKGGEAYLTEVVIPETTLCDGFFTGCTALTKVTFPTTLLATSSMAALFPEVYEQITEVVLTGDGERIPADAFKGCTALKVVEIPACVTEIGAGAFDGCPEDLYDTSSMPGMTLLNGWVIAADAEVVSGTLDLADVTGMSDDVFVIGLSDDAFRGCTQLTGVIVPDEIAGFKPEMFLGCSNLAYVSLPGDFYGLVSLDPAYGWAEGATIEFRGPEMPFEGEWEAFTEGDAAIRSVLTEDGAVVKFVAEDDSVGGLMTLFTGPAQVTFKWKASCEGLFKGEAYDYLAFEIDGAQQELICGETAWQTVTFEVRGEGDHELTWTFVRDEEGGAGENCAWLADVVIAPFCTMGFDANGATAGTAPAMVDFFAGESVRLPEAGTLERAKYTFSGWTDGETVYAAGETYTFGKSVMLTAVWTPNTLEAPVIHAPEQFEADTCTVTITAEAGTQIRYTLDGAEPTAESTLYTGALTITKTTTIKAIALKANYFESAVSTWVVQRGVWTFGEYLNWPEQSFTTGGDAAWVRVKGVSPDGYALRSGAITHNQKSQLEMVVEGPGALSFLCRVEGEVAKKTVWDGLAFYIDGVQQGELIGEEAWVTRCFTIEGPGTHTLTWAYVKDAEGNGDGEDCAWIDQVAWFPGDFIPAMDAAATADEVADALSGSVDARLVAKITTATEYVAYRAWAMGLQSSTVKQVKESEHAWLSYMLHATNLIQTAPQVGDLVVDTLTSVEVDGALAFTLNLKDVIVGEGALEANLRQLFTIEGAPSLSTGDFSTETFELKAVQSDAGKIKVMVQPKPIDGVAPKTFFFRVKMDW